MDSSSSSEEEQQAVKPKLKRTESHLAAIAKGREVSLQRRAEMKVLKAAELSRAKEVLHERMTSALAVAPKKLNVTSDSSDSDNELKRHYKEKYKTKYKTLAKTEAAKTILKTKLDDELMKLMSAQIFG